jgi:erythromycin esterase
MRRYNQDPAHVRKLHFRGFDVEFTSHAIPALIGYLDKVDRPLASRASEFLAPLRDEKAEFSYGPLVPALQARTQRGISEILAKFDSERTNWTARSSQQAFATARQHARMIERSEAVFRDPSRRDRAMADTVEDILDREPKGAKIILLGHNLHMSAQRWDMSEMGALLRERHGSDYFIVGTTFSTGSLHAIAARKPGQAPGPRLIETFTLGPPPPSSLEAALALAQKSLFAVDLRSSTGNVGDWLASKMPTRWVGGIFRGEANSNTLCAPKKSYDALVYIDKVTASHLNPGAN